MWGIRNLEMLNPLPMFTGKAGTHLSHIPNQMRQSFFFFFLRQSFLNQLITLPRPNEILLLTNLSELAHNKIYLFQRSLLRVSILVTYYHHLKNSRSSILGIVFIADGIFFRIPLIVADKYSSPLWIWFWETEVVWNPIW